MAWGVTRSSPGEMRGGKVEGMARKIEIMLVRDVDFDSDSLAEAYATIAGFAKLYEDKYDRVVFRRIYRDDDCEDLALVGIRDETPEEAAQHNTDVTHFKQRKLAEAKELVSQLERELGEGK